MKNIFESYLMEVHARDYHGTDDNMPDDFEKWLGELDTQELMDHAEELLSKQYLMIERLTKIAGDSFDELKKIVELST